MVVTLSHGFDIDGLTRAIVGFDISLGPARQSENDLAQTLRNTIADLNGNVLEVNCRASGDSACFVGGGDEVRGLNSTQQTLKKEWNCEWTPTDNDDCAPASTSPKDQDQLHVLVLGNIQKLAPLKSEVRKRSEIHFSLPIRSHEQDKDNVHVLLASVNLSSYHTFHNNDRRDGHRHAGSNPGNYVSSAGTSPGSTRWH